jgi:Protein of unknown function (DUF1761)
VVPKSADDDSAKAQQCVVLPTLPGILIHMTSFFTPFTIFIATCAGYLAGFLWFSPFLFAKAWVRGEGLTASTLPKRTKQEMFAINLYSLIAHGAITTVLALMLDILPLSSYKVTLSFSLLLTFGLIVTTKFIDMIYTPHGKHFDARSQIKFLVSSGYYLMIMTVITSVLFYLR